MKLTREESEEVAKMALIKKYPLIEEWFNNKNFITYRKAFMSGVFKSTEWKLYSALSKVNMGNYR